MCDVFFFTFLLIEDSFRRALIDKALINMIVTDLQPLSIVKDQGFLMKSKSSITLM